MSTDIRDRFDRIGDVAASLCAELNNLYAQGRTSDMLIAIMRTLSADTLSLIEIRAVGQRTNEARIAA